MTRAKRKALRSDRPSPGKKDLRAQLVKIADQLAPLCLHISVRGDKAGPYIFAIGEDDVHSLEVKHIRGKFVVELWHGKTAEVERVVAKPGFVNAAAAASQARAWLAARD